MLTLEQFTAYIEALRASDKAYDAVSDAGVDLWKFRETYCLPTHILTKAVFNEDQLDTLEWWLYDCPKGITGKVIKKHAIIYLHDKPKWRLYTIEALHSYLMELEC
jgi:hypothetical protein